MMRFAKEGGILLSQNASSQAVGRLKIKIEGIQE
jgi:hypothetical protein